MTHFPNCDRRDTFPNDAANGAVWSAEQLQAPMQLPHRVGEFNLSGGNHSVRAGQILAVLCVFTLGVSRADEVDPAGRADALIAQSKEASGGLAWDRAVMWHERGRVAAGGLTGEYQAWASMRSLFNAQHYVLGPVSGSNGWDGVEAWTTDSSGEVRLETSGESVAQARQDAYRGVYAFYLPLSVAERTYVGLRTVDGADYEVVRITPAEAEPFEIWLDPSTHLIEREVQLTGGQPHVFIFSDFRRFDGVLVPGKTIDRVGNDPQFDTVSEISSLTLNGPDEPAQYSPPAAPANSAQWPRGADSLTVPFKLLNNHIYLMASINGGKPRPFLFDTGATNFIEGDTAKALGLKMEGALAGGGFGDGLARIGFTSIRSISIGGLSLSDQIFGVDYAPSFSEVESGREGFAGLLGYEFAKRAVISIDYQRHLITFTKSSSFHPPAPGVQIPFAFNAHVPMVTGQLDGVSGEFEIDTGSQSALTLMAPFAQANHLAEKYGATHSAIVGYGVGGPSRALLARAGALTIGGLTIYSPVAEIITDKGGVAVSTRTAGNIGGDLLRRFTLTLDYGRQLLWMQPNKQAFESDNFDRSGLWISRAPDGRTVIADVTTGSPAAHAGLAPNEEILELNGKKAEHIRIEALREMFKGPVGARIWMVVKGRTGTRPVAITLAELL